MLIKRLAITGAGLLMATGCITMPDDAPTELHAAKTSLDEAYKQDVDDKLPNTMDKANTAFKESMDLFKDSKDFQSNDEPALATDAKAEAIAKANQSKNLSTSALSLNDDLKSWDNNIDLYSQVKSNVGQTEKLQKEIADLQGKQGVISDDFLIVKPVAFFKTDNASLDNSVENDVENLVTLLNKHKLLYVELTGFADIRGPQEYNKTLGMQRAEAVAEILKGKGIEPARIKMTSLGSDLAANDTLNPARLQLDRRVEAKLTVLSH